MAHTFWSIKDRALIFGVHDPCDKPFQVMPCRDLWPSSRSKLLPGGGPQFSEFACECFILRAVRLSNKLLGQGYVKERLRSYLRKFYGRYGDLIKQYEPPSPEYYTTLWMMTIYSDILHWSGITPFCFILLPNLTFYLIARGFHRTFAMGAACQQRTLTPPDTWSCPTLRLKSVLMLRPISPELALFPDFCISNIPRYFWFAAVA